MLYLYSGITPNLNANIHYFFSNHNNYLAELETHKIDAITNDKYVVNNGFINVAPTDVTIKNLYKCSYVCEYDNGLYRYYHVEHVEQFIDYVRIFVSLDNWSTFISNVNIGNMHVLRANIQNPTGFYPSAKAIKGTYTTNALNNTSYSETSFGVVAVVAYEVGDIINDKVTTTEMFYIQATASNTLDKLIHMFSGIYSVNGGVFSDKKAQCYKLYIVPHALITTEENPNNYGFNYKSIYGNGSIVPAKVVRPHTKSVHYTTPTTTYKRALYVGTNTQFMPVEQRYNGVDVNYTFVYNDNELQVIVYANGNNMDITQSFGVDFVTNTTYDQHNRKTSQAVQGISSAISGAISLATGNPIYAIMNATTGANSLINNNIGVTPMGQLVSGGSALTTIKIDNNFVCPFRYIAFATDENINNAADYEGLYFNNLIMTLQALLSSQTLTANTYHYIQATNVEIEGANITVANEIINAFSRGIKIKNV